MYKSVEILEGVYESVEFLPSSKKKEFFKEGTSVNKPPLSNGHTGNPSHIENIDTTVNKSNEVPDDFKGTRRPSVALPSGKDGGYGYVVLLVSTLVNVLSVGWARTFVLVIIAVQEDFDDYSTESAGVVIGLNMGFSRLLIPMWGWFIERFGNRACGIVGTLIMSSSLLIATQASTMLGTAIPLGVMWGMGMSMVNLPGVFLVTQYFEKYRATAHGIRMAGMPLGGMILPFVFLGCRITLGLKGSFILISGILLNIAVLSALYRPFEVNQYLVQHQYFRTHIKDREKFISLLGDERGDSTTKKPEKKGLEWSYLKNPVFAVHLVVGTVFTGALLGLTFRQMYARSIGISSSDITMVNTLLALFELLFRPVVGAMVDRKIVTSWKATVFGMGLYGIITAMVPLMWDFWSFLVLSLLQSIGSSIYITLVSVVIASLYGQKLLPTTYGFFRSIGGIFVFIYPVFIGMIIDATGSMHVAFYVMSAMGVMSSLIMMLQPIVNRKAGLNINFT